MDFRVYARGEMIFSEGDVGDALYAVASGSVRVSTSSSEGKTAFLNLMEYGDIFGEVAVPDGEARTATAEAVINARLIVITRADFLTLLARVRAGPASAEIVLSQTALDDRHRS